MITSIIIYGVTFSYLTILKHNSFLSFGADLGIFNQALYTTLFNGKLLYYTLELYVNPTGCFFAVHFSPILFIALPFYAIYPCPETLLIFQAFILAAAAAPLYLIAKALLKNKKYALAFAFTYLTYPPLHGANWFDFHTQIFIPILLFSAYYFYIRESWKLYFITSLLSLTIEEHLFYIVFSINILNILTIMKAFIANESIHQAVFHLRNMRYLERIANTFKSAMNDGALKTSTLVVASSIGYLLLTLLIKRMYPITEELIDLYRAVDTYKILGFREHIVYLPLYIISNPQKAYEALSYDYHVKFLYILILFCPLLFTCFLSKTLLIILLVIVPMLFTNYLPYYTLGAQYPLYVIPLIFIASIEGFSKFKQNLKDILKLMLIASLIFSVSISPLSPLAYKFPGGIFWYSYPFHLEPRKDTVEFLHKLTSMIPPNASILTSNNLFPHVSSRINAYVVPLDFPVFLEQRAKEFIENYTRNLIAKSDYVLLNIKGQSFWENFTSREIQSHYKFGVFAMADSYFIFKRNYSGSATFIPYGRYMIFECYQDFILNLGKIVSDETSKSKIVVLFHKNISRDEYVLYGPYTYLPPGSFKISFEIKAQEPEEGLIALFDVADKFGTVILTQKSLYSSELKEGWFNITLTFMNNELRSHVEFRILSTNKANIYADRVIIEYTQETNENS